jgi:hypothetical protein
MGFYVKIALLQLGCPPHPDWSIFLTPDNLDSFQIHFNENVCRKAAGDKPAAFV